MKTGKRILSIFLVALMLLTAAPLAGIVGLEIAPKAKAYSVGDTIQFGTYPQTKVEETTALKNAANAATWRSYGYYTGTGDPEDGLMTPSDYMVFADFFCNGTKYRAVKFTQYRPYYTGYQSDASYTCQDENGYLLNNNYYFKYEPLNWRVLDPSDGYIMCESLIDSQAYQYDINSSSYDNDYATSSIRDWLNYDFYETAFAADQKENIKTTELNNDALYSQYSSVSTNDKIFLLSLADTRNTFYGFSLSSIYETPQGTDYAKCQGLWVSTYLDFCGNSAWWLRTPSNYSDCACAFWYDGEVIRDQESYSTSTGVRPACKLSNLRSDISQSESLFSEGGSSVEVPVEPDWDEVDSGFTIGRDSNCFWHGPSDIIDSGFYGCKNYTLSPSFTNMMTKMIILRGGNFWDRFKYGVVAPWSGACFGIAMTMALLHEGYISVHDLTERNCSNYYSIGKPCEDPKFLDNIHYYYLLEYVFSQIGKTYEMAEARTVNSYYYDGLENQSLNQVPYSAFMKELVSYLSTGKIAVLCTSDHAVLATGVKYNKSIYNENNGYYTIKIYDMNTFGLNTDGYFKELMVDKDFSSFVFYNGNKDLPYDESNEITDMNFKELIFFDPASFKDFIYGNTQSHILDFAFPTSVSFALKRGQPLQIVSSNNQVLNYDGTKLSGDMAVLDISFDIKEEESNGIGSIIVTVPFSKNYTIQSDSAVDIAAFSEQALLSLTANNIDKAIFDFDSGIDVFGSDYSFDAFVSVDEEVAADQNGLMSVSGEANGHIHIGKDPDGIQLSSDELIENVKGTTYLGLTREENEYGNVDSLQIKAEKETAHQLDEFEIVEKATCTEDGLKKGICSKCLQEIEKPIPATGNHVDADNDGYCDTCEEMMRGGDHCKYCGKIHDGFFGWLVKFFHSIFAIFKR